MLITIENYKKITGKTLADDEAAKVEALLKVAISYIENILGYTLDEGEVTEIYPYRKTVYLNSRPVQEVKKVSLNEHWREGKNFVEFPNFKECPCCDNDKEVVITYVKGYKEIPDWLKYEICSLIEDFINSFDEEINRYTSYKIDDIAYSMRDLMKSKSEKINGIVRLIYGN